MRYLFPKKTSKKSDPRGFSLGEVILSAFVLTVGLVSITALVTGSMRETFNSRDTIIATELAQEGVELARNVRDDDFASGATGFSAITGFSVANDHCRMNYNDSVLQCVSGAANTPANNPSRYYLQRSGGYYQHTGVSERFSRYLYVDFNGTDAAIVKSFVYWGATPPTGIDSGVTTDCIVSKKCVYTQISLANWL